MTDHNQRKSSLVGMPDCSFPVRAYVDLVAPAAALHPAFEPRHLGPGRIARHVDQCLVPARGVEAGGEQVMRAELVNVRVIGRPGSYFCLAIG